MLCRRGKSSCADTSQQASSVSSRERKRAWLLAPGFLGLRVAEQLGERKNSVWLRGVSACVAWLVSRTFSQPVGVCCLQFALDSLWIKALCCSLELLLTPPKPWHPPERWFEGSTQPHLLPSPPCPRGTERLPLFYFFLPSSPPFLSFKNQQFLLCLKIIMSEYFLRTVNIVLLPISFHCVLVWHRDLKNFFLFRLQ